MTSKLFVLLVLVAILGLINGADLFQEEPCSRVGGQCLVKSDCSNSIPDEHLNLCPKQKHLGAECCHGYSAPETRCKSLRGSCLRAMFCQNTILKQATDCPEGKVCCRLF